MSLSVFVFKIFVSYILVFASWDLGLGIWDLGLKTLNDLGDKRSKVGRHQTQEDTQAGVKGKVKEVAGFQQIHVFAGKGGEGGEAAAEAYGEKHAPFGGEEVAFFGHAIEDAYQQATHDVDHKGAVWKCRHGVGLHVARGEKTGHTAQKTTCANH